MILLMIWACLIPILILVIGIIFQKHAPKEINGFIGYRTRRSMQSQEAWDYANKRMGEIWLALGVILLVVTIPLSLLLGENGVAVLVIAQTIALILSIIPVEMELKAKFDS
ncbi:MAG: SdpI family protein [Lachnospiraceae bacterium]|nr:SdpI family protein [Cuneatibacter sp.]MDD6456767.1 SdpI family protein [Lachnospiraceae bacterium]